MSNSSNDKVFAGSIPKLYEEYLVPLIFEPFAADIANRLITRSISSVLEVAAGTGVVTRSLTSALPENVSITATDLNQAMLDQASSIGKNALSNGVKRIRCNCRFKMKCLTPLSASGAMFFPDKSKAFCVMLLN